MIMRLISAKLELVLGCAGPNLEETGVLSLLMAHLLVNDFEKKYQVDISCYC